jgi:hypothetical protein
MHNELALVKRRLTKNKTVATIWIYISENDINFRQFNPILSADHRQLLTQVLSISTQGKEDRNMSFDLALDCRVVLAETPIWDPRLRKLYWTDLFEGAVLV